MNSIDKKIVMREALDKVIAASRDYLPPDGITKDEFINRVIEAIDNPRINEAMQ